MSIYIFKIELRGEGDDPDEAYRNACEEFELDWGTTPDFKIETNDD